MSPAEQSTGGDGGGAGVLADLLGGVPLGDIGLSGVVILIVLMILTDKLVTRKRLEEAREDAKTYRAAAETKDAVNAELMGAVKELLSLARATHYALTEIQSLGQVRHENPGGSA